MSISRTSEVTAGIGEATEPLVRQFVHRPLSDEFFAEALDDISRSYRDLPVKDESAVPLWEELGAWVRATAAQLAGEYQITVYDDLDPYETAEQMHADIARGVYKVTSLHSNHPVWDKDTNVAFRITHDITGHGLTRSDFSFRGEVAAYRNQCLSTPEHLWPVLFTEVVAQSAYANVHHLFGEQKVALLPLTQAEIDAHVGQVMDAPDPDYDPLHVSASQRQWYDVADSIKARQTRRTAARKPVFHFLHDDDETALRKILEHHSGEHSRTGAVLGMSDDAEFGRAGLDEIRTHEGFTVHDHFGDSPRSGYMVSISPATEKTVSLATITAQDIADYRNAHAALLADPSNYFGAWVFEGNVYLDISRNVPDLDEALALGRQYHQLGIYDLASNQTIEVPGSTHGKRKVFAMRTCDHCGTRMSPWMPRKRLPSGDLVCRGCENKHKEAVLSLAQEMDTVTCPRCEGDGDVANGVVCDLCNGTGTISLSDLREYSLRTVAHDSGDGERIFHCPFCGGGSIVGRSDGTAQCQFCSTTFTVQVQPERSAVPQTIDGVPHVHPDMPGGPTSNEPGQAPEDPAAQADDVSVTPGTEQPKMYAQRVVQREAQYVAADGMAMPEKSYLRHIALRFADNRDDVLAAMRGRSQGERR